MKHYSLIVFLALALMLVAIAYFNFNKPNETKLQEELTLARHLENCENKSLKANCYNNIFGKLLSVQPPAEVFSQFLSSMKESSYVLLDCHQVAHALGRETFSKIGTISETYEIGKDITICSGGFYHGAIEKLFRPDTKSNDEHITVAEIGLKVPTLCDGLDTLEKESECYHGIGHGTFYILENIEKTIDICKLIPNKKDHFACYSGLFMEYESTGTANSSPKKDDPHFPCDELDDPYKNPCYYVQSFRMANLGLSDNQIIKECRSAPSPAGVLCVRGFGIFFLAHKALSEGFEGVVSFCQSLDRKDERVCAESVASRLAANKQSGEDAYAFCSMFKDEYIRKRCFSYTIGVLNIGHNIEMESLISQCSQYLEKDINVKECTKAAE